MKRVPARLQSWLMRDLPPDTDAVWAEDEPSMAHEPLHAPLSDVEVVAPHFDFTEESGEATRPGARELQLR
jgi:hypothetical protein